MHLANTVKSLMLTGALYDRIHKNDLGLSPVIILAAYGVIFGIILIQIVLQNIYYSNDFILIKVSLRNNLKQASSNHSV